MIKSCIVHFSRHLIKTLFKKKTTYFRSFPLGKHEAVRLKQWLVNMRRKDWRPTTSSCLCSAHFEENDFTKDSNVKICLPKSAFSFFFLLDQFEKHISFVLKNIQYLAGSLLLTIICVQ